MRITRSPRFAKSASSWGGPITLSGPFLIIPVERERTRTVKDEDGTTRTETFTERTHPVVLMPETLEILAEERQRRP